jgi:uncharacterized membrane protein YcaP (DUF421 family)
MLFDSWYALLHTLVVGTLAYVGLIALLRLSGKRTLSKWNPFDFIITVAFGSVMATALVSEDTTLTKGLVAFALLVVLQYGITALSVRFSWVRSLIKAKPVLLLCRGELLHDALRRERVSEGEVLAALRARGVGRVADVEAVVLETDGSVSVVEKEDAEGATTLRDVEGYAYVS